ncbi:mucin-13-like isoform X2 [Macrobrachium nipponense]|uniref:mucin-13-like isoform X2 n=1 Tax=Macrobrachium nipponense TaxID=159736 RepID=UPI0030C835E5
MKTLLTATWLVFLFYPYGTMTACPQAFSQSSGTFTSPNYPNNYPSSTTCTYIINTGSKISITCQKFDLQGKSASGTCLDFLQISDSNILSTKYCSTTGPQNYVTTTTNVTVIFKSDASINRPGFNCTYQNINTTTTSPTTTTTTKPTTTSTTTTTTKPTTTSTSTTTTSTSTATTKPTTTTSTSTTTKLTTTTTKSTTNSSTAVPDLLQKALNAYNSGSCSTTTQNKCGCTNPVSGFYTTITGNYRIVAATGIPSHVFEQGQQKPNPNKGCEHRSFMAIPVSPVKGSTYKAYGMGPVGIAISGAFFYNHLSSTQGDTAVFNEQASFDTCNGHSDQNCRYHYHEVPVCIAGNSSCANVGYMRDGFPVYTFCTHPTKSRYLKSCYYKTSGDGSNQSHYTFNTTAKNNGDCDLDEANGYTFSDQRGYAYIFTADYPFIMAGYYGTQLSNICYLYT